MASPTNPFADDFALSAEEENIQHAPAQARSTTPWRHGSTSTVGGDTGGDIELTDLRPRADVEKGRKGSAARTRATEAADPPASGATETRFRRMGWKRLTIVLIVQTIALGVLGLPKAFATLGMLLGIFFTSCIGYLALTTSFVIGQVKLLHPGVANYADAGRLLMGRFGYEVVSAMFLCKVVCLVASHCLTGAIAFEQLFDVNGSLCSIWLCLAAMFALLFLAIPPSFSEQAILGYVDFASIILAIGVTVVGTGVAADGPDRPPGDPWSWYPREDATNSETMTALGNIVFSYSYAVCQFTFMDDMHTPRDFGKSVKLFTVLLITVYVLTGALIYGFVGTEVQAPALLSLKGTVAKAAWAVALPVIFISGSINTVVAGRYLHGRIYKNSPLQYINTAWGWVSWIIIIGFITILSFFIAEAVPFFDNLLTIVSSLFGSAFTMYLPSVMWFKLIKRGKWHTRENLTDAMAYTAIFTAGMMVLLGGMYYTITDLVEKTGSLGNPFSCTPLSDRQSESAT
ncbi:hypothetical protein S40288_04667 [Stachybotrys chartarum IBT 40288]|nr:hypothetical protein S40288_04667 [Stachybotrys chartarum IBT 40288]